MTTLATLDALRDKLLDQRRELLALGEEAGTAREGYQPREAEPEERAANDAARRGAALFEEREREEIVAIDDALKRIEAGSYGLCVDCGDTINEKRLMAIPWTARCEECKEARENQWPFAPNVSRPGTTSSGGAAATGSETGEEPGGPIS